MLITAGIVLLNILFGALFRPPKPTSNKIKVNATFAVSIIIESGIKLGRKTVFESIITIPSKL